MKIKNMRYKRRSFLPALVCLAVSLAVLGSCGPAKEQNNVLTDQEVKDGWKLLFDGQTTDGWHLYNRGKVPSAWVVVNGELYCKPDGKLEHGDLISDSVYENFDLQFEWKIIKYGNSGVFVDVQEDTAIRTAWASGPEYQLLEASNPDNADPLKRSGCLFGLFPQLNPASLKPLGDWNQSRIVQQNGVVEFWLNGVQTLKEDFKSQGWADTVAKSHFAKFPEFGKHTKGKIGLQDWSKGVSFRNVKIKEL